MAPALMRFIFGDHVQARRRDFPLRKKSSSRSGTWRFREERFSVGEASLRAGYSMDFRKNASIFVGSAMIRNSSKPQLRA